MGDVGDDFRAFKKLGQENRARNRKNSPSVLTDHGVEFESKNMGAHLIVTGADCLIDFWPGTGKWIARNGKRGFGVFNLLKLCSETKKAPE